MKEYTKPEATLIEMEPESIIAQSAVVSNGGTVTFRQGTSSTMSADRNRQADWSGYEE